MRTSNRSERQPTGKLVQREPHGWKNGAAYGIDNSGSQVKGIKISGKTGTVKKIGNLGYEEKSLNALFVGQASLNQKNLIVGVIIRDSQVNGSGGGDVAAPSFANFINKIRQKEGYYDF